MYTLTPGSSKLSGPKEKRMSHDGSVCFPGGAVIKNPPASAGNATEVGQEDPLEEGMATHSSILAWEIPWTEEPGGLQSMGSQRVGQD